MLAHNRPLIAAGLPQIWLELPPPDTELLCCSRRSENEGSPEPATGSVIEMIDGTPVLRLRERLLPLIDLGGLLQIEQPPSMTPKVEADVVIAVIAIGAATLGIVVDRVFDTEEVVVKPVASILRHITMFSGNTILGDGSVIMILDPNGIARAIGLNTTVAARLVAPTASAPEQTGASTAMLVFRAGEGGPPCAVPLGLVARIEDIPREMIEQSSGRLMTQYRGQLIPLLQIDATQTANGGSQAVLVFSDRGRSMGLMVAEIVDVIEARLSIELVASCPGMLGSAVIAGRATDVLDAGYWMTLAWQDWFRDTIRGPAHAARARLLVVEDSAFFRQLVVPALSAAGYHVVAVESAAKALALQAGGPDAGSFDAIVSDIEMPDMDGLAFARLVRNGGAWANLPLIALSGRASAEDIARGRAAGFTDYVAKFEREPLLASLQRCLAPQAGLSLATA